MRVIMGRFLLIRQPVRAARPSLPDLSRKPMSLSPAASPEEKWK